ncbi:MAG: hypothetical protein ACK4KW_03650 [Gemmobacter sp.]
MLPVLHGDLVAVARALRAAPEPERAALCREILAQAGWARSYARALGRRHPHWGSGSLMEAAGRFPQAREPFLSDPDWLHCLWVVVGELLDRARRHRAARRGAGWKNAGERL